MSQSLSRIWLHIVFSTKDRRTLLHDAALRDEMWRVVAHHANECGCICARAGGWVDHAHVLCGLSRTITVAKLVETLKRESSKWAKKRAPNWRSFYWQNGYGAFSVSQSLIDQAIAYIDEQSKHHERTTFQEEFRALCERHRVKLDERYVWD